MSLFDHALRKHAALLALGLIVCAAGVTAFLGMPRSLFPEVDYPRVTVTVNMGYAPLQTMEWGVSAPLERQLRGVQGVRLVKSSTSRGLSTIAVYLDQNEDVTLAIQRVTAKLAEARGLLPASAQITVRPITAAAFPGAEYAFTASGKTALDLRAWVEYQLRPLVLGVPGIFDVRALGGDLPELAVKLDPRKLARRNLTVADVDDRLRNSNNVDFIGPLPQAGGGELLAFGGKFTATPQALEDVVVDTSLGNAVRLRDLGVVLSTSAWKTKDVSLDGAQAVALDVFYQPNIDQKAASRAVADVVKKAVAASGGAYRYKSWDLNDFTDTATNAVLVDLSVGMAIIGLVTFLFLRRWRYSLIALLTMPVAASLTFLVMRLRGLSINLMTLGGLTAAIGLVVDNAVIVIEMYHHRREEAPDAPAAQVLAQTLSAVARPMIYGTATIALVFTPIAFLSGISGMFFAPMADVHGSSLALSVLLALFVAPGLLLLLGGRAGTGGGGHDEFQKGRAASWYGRLLSKAVRRPRRWAAAALLLPLVGLGLSRFALTGFLPEWDEGDIVIDFRSPTPLSLVTTVAKVEPIEDYLKTVPEVDFFVRKVGTGLAEFDNPPYRGEIIMKLKKKRKKSVFVLRDEIAARAAQLAPDLELDLFQILPDRINDLSGSLKPVVLYLRGPDEKSLTAAAAAYQAELAKVKGLASVRIEEPAPAPEALYAIDERRSRAVDLNPTQLDAYARFAVFNLDSSYVQQGPQTIPIRLSMDDSLMAAPFAARPVYTARGGLEALGRLGTLRTATSRVEATHLDGTPVRTLTAEIAGRDLGSVVADVKKVLAAKPLPGVTVELAGDYLTQQQSFRQLVLAFLAGIALIFSTAALFTDDIALALLLAGCALIPPSLGLAGLVALRVPLDVSSFSGLISVTGIMVANAFMALTAIWAGRRAGRPRLEAIVEGMKSRLRPILMTNLAAMAGFLPIAIGLATGDEILRPFSVAIIIGLFGAMFATLVAMPVCCAGFRPDVVGSDA